MKIEFIIPTYIRTNHLMCLLYSLKSQTNQNWVAHVVADKPPEGVIEPIIEHFSNDKQIKFTILPERYNDWGHTPRNYGVQNSNEDWVVMTGEDNYYVPTFVDEFLKMVENNVHFVHCNLVHNWPKNQYVPLVSETKKYKIDIGNFMCRTFYAKQLKLNVKKIDADGYFVEQYIKTFKGTVKHINKLLYVHN